jgi:hypothetical protein
MDPKVELPFPDESFAEQRERNLQDQELLLRKIAETEAKLKQQDPKSAEMLMVKFELDHYQKQLAKIEHWLETTTEASLKQPPPSPPQPKRKTKKAIKKFKPPVEQPQAEPNPMKWTKENMTFQEKQNEIKGRIYHCQQIIRKLEEERGKFKTWQPPYEEIQRAIVRQTHELNAAEQWLATATEESEKPPPLSEERLQELTRLRDERRSKLLAIIQEREGMIRDCEAKMEQLPKESSEYRSAYNSKQKCKQDLSIADKQLLDLTIEKLRWHPQPPEEELELWADYMKKPFDVNDLPEEQRPTLKRDIFSDDEASEEEDEDERIGDAAMEEEEEEEEESYERQLVKYENWRIVKQEQIDLLEEDLKSTKKAVERCPTYAELRVLKRRIKDLINELEEAREELEHTLKPLPPMDSTKTFLERANEYLKEDTRRREKEMEIHEKLRYLYMVPEEEEIPEEEEDPQEEEEAKAPLPRAPLKMSFYPQINDEVLKNMLAKHFYDAQVGQMELIWCSKQYMDLFSERIGVGREDWRGRIISIYRTATVKRLIWIWRTARGIQVATVARKEMELAPSVWQQVLRIAYNYAASNCMDQGCIETIRKLCDGYLLLETIWNYRDENEEKRTWNTAYKTFLRMTKSLKQYQKMSRVPILMSRARNLIREGIQKRYNYITEQMQKLPFCHIIYNDTESQFSGNF